MEIVAKIIGELFAIASIFIFIFFVGIKIECPSCGKRFYHQKKICPDCDYEYGAPLPDQKDEIEDEAPDLSDQSDPEVED